MKKEEKAAAAAAEAAEQESASPDNPGIAIELSKEGVGEFLYLPKLTCAICLADCHHLILDPEGARTIVLRHDAQTGAAPCPNAGKDFSMPSNTKMFLDEIVPGA